VGGYPRFLTRGPLRHARGRSLHDARPVSVATPEVRMITAAAEERVDVDVEVGAGVGAGVDVVFDVAAGVVVDAEVGVDAVVDAVADAAVDAAVDVVGVAVDVAVGVAADVAVDVAVDVAADVVADVAVDVAADVAVVVDADGDGDVDAAGESEARTRRTVDMNRDDCSKCAQTHTTAAGKELYRPWEDWNRRAYSGRHWRLACDDERPRTSHDSTYHRSPGP
jgi:hypothetical protein